MDKSLEMISGMVCVSLFVSSDTIYIYYRYNMRIQSKIVRRRNIFVLFV